MQKNLTKLLWCRVSLVLIALFSDTGMPDAITAAIASIEVVANNTAVMLLRGTLLASLVTLSLLLPLAAHEAIVNRHTYTAGFHNKEGFLWVYLMYSKAMQHWR